LRHIKHVNDTIPQHTTHNTQQQPLTTRHISAYVHTWPYQDPTPIASPIDSLVVVGFGCGCWLLLLVVVLVVGFGRGFGVLFVVQAT
jgi:hypothetical protein